MATIAYKNQFGDVIMENVDKFDIRGTIMSRKVVKVNGCIGFDIIIEDAKGRYKMIVWDYHKGFDSDKIKQGYGIRVRGVIHKQGYTDKEGKYAYYNQYKVQEVVE